MVKLEISEKDLRLLNQIIEHEWKDNKQVPRELRLKIKNMYHRLIFNQKKAIALENNKKLYKKN